MQLYNAHRSSCMFTRTSVPCGPPFGRRRAHVCPPSMPRTFIQHGACRQQVFATALGQGTAGSANYNEVVLLRQMQQLYAETKKVRAELKEAWAALLKDPDNKLLRKRVDDLKEVKAGLDERSEAMDAKLLGDDAATGGGLGAADEPTYKYLRFILPGSFDIHAVMLLMPRPSSRRPFVTYQAVLDALERNDVTAVSDVTYAFELGLSSELEVDNLTSPHSETFADVMDTQFIDGHIYWTRLKNGRRPEVTSRMRSMIRGFETKAVEKGLAMMRESHPNDHVKLVDQKEFTLADGFKMELQGLVEAGACVLVVEAKTKITKDTVKEVDEKLAKIRSIKQTDPLGHRFLNKEVQVALAGLTLDEHAREAVQEKMKLGWKVWLPDAGGLELEDA